VEGTGLTWATGRRLLPMRRAPRGVHVPASPRQLTPWYALGAMEHTGLESRATSSRASRSEHRAAASSRGALSRAATCLLVLVASLLLDAGSADAQGPEGQAPLVGDAPAPMPEPAPAKRREPGEALEVYVLTFSPGDHPFYKFGHNAIYIRDPESRDPRKRDLVYNWGTFTFGDPALLPKFLMGRFMYWLSIQSLDSTKRVYQRENRSIDIQELDLSPAQKLELKRRVDENAKQENRYYKYDYYRDNCSTRVRDMIDGVLEGRLKAVSSDPARLSYRDHTLRLTADFVSVNLFLGVAMGEFIDRPIQQWDEAFIPMELQSSLRRVKLVGEDGAERPLVKSERVLLTANRTPPLENPPVWWPHSLAAGLAFGGALFGLARAASRKQKPARIALGAILALLGLVTGFFAFAFMGLWFFTDHAVAYRNENILLLAPWTIVLVGTGLRLAAGRAKSIHFANKLVGAAAVSSLVAVALKLPLWFGQDNLLYLLFFVPTWGLAAVGLRELARATPTSVPPAGTESSERGKLPGKKA
jgi:hypothetical protein